MSQLHETPEPVGEGVEEIKVSEVVEGEVEEVAEEVPLMTLNDVKDRLEEVPLMTLNDVKDRLTGIVNNARAAGVATVTSRGFAAVESFLGALAGDKENRPKR